MCRRRALHPPNLKRLGFDAPTSAVRVSKAPQIYRPDEPQASLSHAGCTLSSSDPPGATWRLSHRACEHSQQCSGIFTLACAYCSALLILPVGCRFVSSRMPRARLLTCHLLPHKPLTHLLVATHQMSQMTASRLPRWRWGVGRTLLASSMIPPMAPTQPEQGSTQGSLQSLSATAAALLQK